MNINQSQKSQNLIWFTCKLKHQLNSTKVKNIKSVLLHHWNQFGIHEDSFGEALAVIKILYWLYIAFWVVYIKYAQTLHTLDV